MVVRTVKAAAEGVGPVSVKPLVWVDGEDGSGSTAVTCFGHVCYMVVGTLWWLHPSFDKPKQAADAWVGDLAPAKAAAQADYDARIRSTLSASPQREGWQPIETIPKEPVAPGWTRGPLVYVKPTWGGWDVGCWEIHEHGENGGCVRMFGDDGSYDEQPTHWQPLSPPKKEG